MPIDLQNARQPGILRHLAAIFYDLLLLAALLTVAAAVVTLLLGIISDAPGELVAGDPLYRLLFQLYLLTLIIGFFCGFWMRGGQTLGMRAWRVMLVRENGGRIRLRDALVRLLAAILSWTALGIGYLWPLFDKDKLTWHDRLSGTRLVMLEKRKKA